MQSSHIILLHLLGQICEPINFFCFLHRPSRRIISACAISLNFFSRVNKGDYFSACKSLLHVPRGLYPSSSRDKVLHCTPCQIEGPMNYRLRYSFLVIQLRPNQEVCSEVDWLTRLKSNLTKS